MTVGEVRNNPTLKLHHTASAMGYVSRKSDGYAEKYSGRFGKGYKLYLPRWDTTVYCTVEYWIEK